MITNNPVGWFEIYVEDMNRAKKFYQDVLQKGDFITILDEQTKMVAFPWDKSKPDISGALVQTASMKPGIGGTLIYFNCYDCSEEESRVEVNGGSVLKSKFRVGQFGFVSIIKDTEGNLIGLHSTK